MRECECETGERSPFNCWSCTADSPEPVVGEAWDSRPDTLNSMWTPPLKVWHDDVRRPPDDTWTWCRTNAKVIEIAYRQKIDVLSMDHDLGGSGIPLEELSDESDFWKLESDETGVHLASFLAAHDLVPNEVIIHSMNPIGAKNIIDALLAFNHCISSAVTVRTIPFRR